MKTTALFLLISGASLHLAGQTTEMIVSYGIAVAPGDNFTLCVNAFYDSEITDPDAQHLNSTINLLIPNGLSVVGITDKCGSWSLGGVTTTATMDILCGAGPYTHYQQQVVQNGPCTTGGTAVGIPQQLFTITLDNACNETTLVRVLQGTNTTYPEDQCLNSIPGLNGNTGTLDNDGNGANASNGGQSFIPPQPGEEATGCPEALPVRFIRFDLEKQGQSALLTWTAVTNTQSAVFVIERFAQHVFEEIGEVAAARTVSTQSYHFIDTEPLPGRSYYRIRQRDLDGTNILSEVRAITFENTETMFVAPNPAHDVVNVHCAACADTDVELVMLSATGNPVHKMSMEASMATIQISDLPAGMYVVQLYNADGIVHAEKLIKLNR
ncbi:MAG: T9SS type A sorting domain-containing protein [Saprospiraceae bacterium]|nr:T9SS type A sorting domain-containing protein [Saprospiraceae bacterium]